MSERRRFPSGVYPVSLIDIDLHIHTTLGAEVRCVDFPFGAFPIMEKSSDISLMLFERELSIDKNTVEYVIIAAGNNSVMATEGLFDVVKTISPGLKDFSFTGSRRYEINGGKIVPNQLSDRGEVDVPLFRDLLDHYATIILEDRKLQA